MGDVITTVEFGRSKRGTETTVISGKEARVVSDAEVAEIVAATKVSATSLDAARKKKSHATPACGARTVTGNDVAFVNANPSYVEHIRSKLGQISDYLYHDVDFDKHDPDIVTQVKVLRSIESLQDLCSFVHYSEWPNWKKQPAFYFAVVKVVEGRIEFARNALSCV